MAHKYDDRYTKGGCAYWYRRCSWAKIYSNRKRRKKAKQDLAYLQEDFVENLHEWYIDKWDIYFW